MKLKTLALINGILLTTLASCGSDDSQSDVKNIFGTDNRVPMTQTTPPYTAIGKLSTGCTATLVGPDLILTAAHCLLGNISNVRFMPNYMNGSSRTTVQLTRVWRGTTNPDDDRKNDWAVAKLTRPIGQIYGYMLPKNVDLRPGYRLTLAGYSGDFRDGETAGVHRNCQIKYRQPVMKVYMHDCDATRGSSGGPMFKMINGQAYLVALNVAERRDGDVSDHVNRFKPSKANIAIYDGDFTRIIKEQSGPMEERGYAMRAKHSRKCVDVERSSLASNSKVLQYTCHNTTNQRFVFRRVGSNYFIYAKHSGKVLDVAGGSRRSGAKIIQADYSGKTSQHWKVQAISTGYKLKNLRSGLCIDVPRSSTDNRIQLIQYRCNNTTNQIFEGIRI